MASIDDHLNMLLARNLRRLRDIGGWTQVELASRARELGLEWTADTVVAIESGRREFTPAEVFLVPQLLKANLAELVKAGDEDLIAVEGHGLEATTWPALIAGRRLRSLGKSLDSSARRLSKALTTREARNEAEKKAARSLGLTAAELVILAHGLWNRGLTDERDARVRAEVGAVDLSPSRRQALRGHITRRLLQELREAIARQNQEAPHEGVRSHE
jgi:transcriptional regulator with XRE-family HTH domain